MILFDILKRKKKLEPLFKRCWQQIGDAIIYPDVVDADPPQKLVYFGQLSYATLFEAAVAVGMTPDSGHYLARMQVGKYKLGENVTRAVEETFSGFETEEQAAYARLFHDRVGRIVAIVSSGEGEITPLLRELAGLYEPVPLDASEV